METNAETTKQPCILLGIAGGTGSGKTTIASKIMDAFPNRSIAMIEHDAYYKPLDGMPIEDRKRVNFDHPDSLDNELLIEHIKRLKSGHPIDKPLYDFVTHSRRPELERVEPTRVVIVEGILIFADPRLRALFDIKLYVDTDADIRVFRRIRRDIEHRGRSFDSIRRQYYRTVRPMHLEFVEPSKRWADLIIPEGGSNQIALDFIIERLRKELG
ncbi:MAG: uridine kinase [Myxococcales bacterium]|nr:uridine kinase [Myxococcales bacterium]